MQPRARLSALPSSRGLGSAAYLGPDLHASGHLVPPCKIPRADLVAIHEHIEYYQQSGAGQPHLCALQHAMFASVQPVHESGRQGGALQNQETHFKQNTSAPEQARAARGLM